MVILKKVPHYSIEVFSLFFYGGGGGARFSEQFPSSIFQCFRNLMLVLDNWNMFTYFVQVVSWQSTLDCSYQQNQRMKKHVSTQMGMQAWDAERERERGVDDGR